MGKTATLTVLTMLAAVWLPACELAQSDTVTARPAPPSGVGREPEEDAAVALPAPDAATTDRAIADAGAPDRATWTDARASAVADAPSSDASLQRPQSCAGGGFVFCEDFEGGAGLWSESGGSWALIEESDPPDTVEGYGPTLTVASEAYVPSFEWGDMTAETDVIVTSFGPSSSTNRAELFARYQDASHSYAIGLRADGKLGLRKNGAALGTPATVSVAENQWHTLKIRVAGAPGAVAVEGYLDGALLVTSVDTSADDASASGTVAVGVYGVTLAVFNDVRVSLP